MKSFSINQVKKECEILIYGTRDYGKLLYHSLVKCGVKPTGFIDNYKSGSYMGVDFYNIDEAKKIYLSKPTIILLGVAWSRKEIVSMLDSNNMEYYDVGDFLELVKFNKDELPEDIYRIYRLRELYVYYRIKSEVNDFLGLKSIDFVVSEKCSLKCRDCSNLMPYYEKPKNINLDKAVNSFDKLLDIVDCIFELRILGGEPFMNSEFYKVVERYVDNPKVLKIRIFTNATILPNSTQIRRLVNRKVEVVFSDYGIFSTNLQKWVSICIDNKIKYEILSIKEWQDCGDLNSRKRSVEELKNIYKSCECKYLPTFLNGKIYSCVRLAHLANLMAIPKDKYEYDYIDFDHSDLDITKQKIRNLLYEQDYLNACDYCSGRNSKTSGIEPHIQIAHNLCYTKYE